MKKFMILCVATVCLSVMFSISVSATGTTTGTSTTGTSNTGAYTTGNNTSTDMRNLNNNYGTAATANDDDMDWGWLGLLGLVGLAGLRKRSRER